MVRWIWTSTCDSSEKPLIFNIKYSFYVTEGAKAIQACIYTHCNQAVTLESCVQQCCGCLPNLHLAFYMKTEHLPMFWGPAGCCSSDLHMATSHLCTEQASIPLKSEHNFFQNKRKIKDTRMGSLEYSLLKWDYVNKHKAVVGSAKYIKIKSKYH